MCTIESRMLEVSGSAENVALSILLSGIQNFFILYLVPLFWYYYTCGWTVLNFNNHFYKEVQRLTGSLSQTVIHVVKYVH